MCVIIAGHGFWATIYSYAGHAVIFCSYDLGSAPLALPTDPTSSPTDLDTTSSPDLASTSDQGINSTTTNVPLSTSTTHDLEDSDSITSQNPVTTYYDQEPETTIPTGATVPPSISQEALDYLPYAVGGAVGAIVVIIAIVLTVVIVSLLIRRSRKKPYKVEPNKDIGLLSYNNALYDVGKEPYTCNAQNRQLHFAVYGQGHLLVLCM